MTLTYNLRDGITGTLCFTRGVFLQVLEGDRSQVNRTFQRIYADKRHKDIMILGFKPIPKRAFERWAMAFVGEDAFTKAILQRYCAADRLVLDYVGDDTVVDMVLDLLREQGAEDQP